MRKISSSIVGLGQIGFKYDINKTSILTHVKAINNSKTFYLKSAIDNNKKNLKLFKNKYNYNTYNSYKNAFKKDKPSLIVISTKMNVSYNICLQAIKNHSTKFILIEKPGSEKISDLKKLIYLAKKKNIYLFINYFRLFNPQYEILKKKLYKCNKFRMVFFYSRGMYNNTSHLISYLVSIFNKPKKISIIKKDPKKKKDIEPDFRLEFKNGDVTFLSSNVNNLSYLKLISLSNNEKIISNSSFNEFSYNNVESDSYIKNYLTYSNKSKKILVNQSKSQKIVYENILKFTEKKKYNKLISIYLNTFEILNKIKNKNDR